MDLEFPTTPTFSRKFGLDLMGVYVRLKLMKCGRDPSDRVRSLKREVEALYQNNVRPGSNRKLDTEVFEMSKFNDKLNKFDKLEKQNSSNKFERKRQLWLSSCSQESGTSTDATYGRFAKDDDMITWWDEEMIR